MKTARKTALPYATLQDPNCAFKERSQYPLVKIFLGTVMAAFAAACVVSDEEHLGPFLFVSVLTPTFALTIMACLALRETLSPRKPANWLAHNQHPLAEPRLISHSASQEIFQAADAVDHTPTKQSI